MCLSGAGQEGGLICAEKDQGGSLPGVAGAAGDQAHEEVHPSQLGEGVRVPFRRRLRANADHYGVLRGGRPQSLPIPQKYTPRRRNIVGFQADSHRLHHHVCQGGDPPGFETREHPAGEGRGGKDRGFRVCADGGGGGHVEGGQFFAGQGNVPLRFSLAAQKRELLIEM